MPSDHPTHSSLSRKSLPGEIWKDVIGYEGYYRVSNLGRVKSIDRIVVRGGNRPGSCLYKGKMLNSHSNCDKISSNGYPQVSLSRNSKIKPMDVHVLVLLTFVGPCPVGMECLHKDGNRRNASLSNLMWGTPKQNQNDRARHGTANQGSRHNFAKLTEDEVLLMRKMFASGKWTQARLSRKFKIGAGVVSLIVRHKIWRHI